MRPRWKGGIPVDERIAAEVFMDLLFWQMLFIDCPGVPKSASKLVMGHSLLLLLLFASFYSKATEARGARR